MKLLFLSAFCALSVSCSSLKFFRDNPILIAPSVQYAAQTVLKEAVDPADLVSKKAELASLAKNLLSLPVDRKLTEAEFREVLSQKLTKGEYWFLLENKIVDSYVKATKDIKDEDIKNVSAVLREIAVGLQNAAK